MPGLSAEPLREATVSHPPDQGGLGVADFGPCAWPLFTMSISREVFFLQRTNIEHIEGLSRIILTFLEFSESAAFSATYQVLAQPCDETA
jgi:hypothetical protein